MYGIAHTSKSGAKGGDHAYEDSSDNFHAGFEGSKAGAEGSKGGFEGSKMDGEGSRGRKQESKRSEGLGGMLGGLGAV